ncbi:MAG TPA: LytTR family DNA-binding domain-containing protein [Caulobacteraceae bacterium]
MQQDMRGRAASLRERTGLAAHASRAAAYLRGDGRGWLIALAAGLFLGFSGAFGSGEAPLGTRVPFWVGLMLAGGLIAQAMAAVVNRSGVFERNPGMAYPGLAVAMTLPMTVVVWLALAAVYRFPLDGRSFSALLLPVFVVSLAMMALNWMAHRRPRETHAAEAGAEPAKFLERLPLKLRGAELYAVEAEDHYLRLHTSRGSDLILMRLGDAVAELEGIEGAQTHRSWWVAKDAVAGAKSRDGRATLTLKNGAEAPVSRTYAAALRREGWW